MTSSTGLVDLTGYRGLGQAAVLYGSRHAIHWYLKPLVTLISPLSFHYRSPFNYIAGRIIARAF